MPKNTSKGTPVAEQPPKPKVNNFFAKKAEIAPTHVKNNSIEKTTTIFICTPGKAEQNRASLKQISKEILFEGIHKDLLFNTVTKALSAAKAKHTALGLFTIFEVTIPDAKLNLVNNHYMFNLRDYITSTVNVTISKTGRVKSEELPPETSKQGKNVKSKMESSRSSIPGGVSQKSQVAMDDIEFSPEYMPSSPISRKR